MQDQDDLALWASDALAELDAAAAARAAGLKPPHVPAGWLEVLRAAVAEEDVDLDDLTAALRVVAKAVLAGDTARGEAKTPTNAEHIASLGALDELFAAVEEEGATGRVEAAVERLAGLFTRIGGTYDLAAAMRWPHALDELAAAVAEEGASPRIGTATAAVLIRYGRRMADA